MNSRSFNQLLEIQLAYVERQAERNTDELRMLRAILELAKRDGKCDRVYDRLAVAEQMRELGWKDRSGKLSTSLETRKLDEALSDDIKHVWDRLQATLGLGGRSRGIMEAARLASQTVFLQPEEVWFDTKNNVIVEGARGPLTRRAYRLIEAPIQAPEVPSPKASLIRPTDITYQLDLARNASWLARPLIRGFGAQKMWRRLAFVLAFISPIAALFLLVVVLLFKTHAVLTPIALGAYATLGMIGGLWWSIFGPFLLVVDSRVEIAPFWMWYWSTTPVLMRWVKVKPDEYPKLEIVRYSASCPVCAGDVCITKSSIEFHGRLVGRCRQNPREHVFSFDHVSLTGRYLR